MSNITLFDAPLPGTLQGGVDEDTKLLAGSSGGGGGIRRLSIKGGVFREMLGNKEYRSS